MVNFLYYMLYCKSKTNMKLNLMNQGQVTKVKLLNVNNFVGS